MENRKQTLVEKYSKRINLAEKYFAKNNNGASVKPETKLGLAQVLENTRKLYEAFENSVSTQRADMGSFKISSMDITTLVYANLLAEKLVLVRPLSSLRSVITYTEFVYGSNKGDVQVGDLIDNPFKLTNAHPNYTGATVEENHELAAQEVEINLGWGPVVPGSIAFQIGNDKYFDAAGKLYKGQFASKVFKLIEKGEDGRLEGVAGHYVVEPGQAVEVGRVQYGYARSKAQSGPIYDLNSPKIIFNTAPVAEGGLAVVAEIAYVYNNVAVMQNDIPTLVARERAITLEAKARRIAINYSNLAALQYKIEYGRDLGKELENKAVHQLKWEIDSEIVDFLVENAGAPAVVFNAVPRTGLSLAQQYEGFAKTIADAKNIIYKRTQLYQPSYMICAPDVEVLLGFVPGFKAATGKKVAGPYEAGTFAGLDVIVNPRLADGTFVLGVNENDFNTSAAVYGPFIAIVPTALLETPDGANAKGWSTMYALELLNKDLLVAGKIEYTPSEDIFSGDIVRVQA